MFGVGKEARVTIGSTGLYSATQARKLATEHLQAIKAGIDPKSVAKMEADKKPTTIESLLEIYLETHKDSMKPRCPSSNKWDRSDFRLSECFARHFHVTRRIVDIANDVSRWSLV